jgi:hypothetical protein
MSQIHKMIAEVRVLLDEPNHQHPTERHLWTLMGFNLQNFSNELQNTGQNWNIASWQLDVVPGTDQYSITPSDFGKPIYILTRSTDPDVQEREVPIVDPQNFNFLVGSHYMGGFGSDHPALAIGFYGQGAMAAGHVCKIAPKPTKAASYTIWYKTGLLPDLALADDLLVPEHHQLLVTRTALAAIPYCRWWPIDEKPDLMMAKAQALQNSIGFLNTMYEETYMKYKSNLRQETMAARILYGENDW